MPTRRPALKTAAPSLIIWCRKQITLRQPLRFLAAIAAGYIGATAVTWKPACAKLTVLKALPSSSGSLKNTAPTNTASAQPRRQSSGVVTKTAAGERSDQFLYDWYEQDDSVGRFR